MIDTGTNTIGNIGTVLTIGTLPNILGGSIVVTAGTINSSTVTLNNGTINVGTFVMPTGTIVTGTLLSSGTTTGVGVVSVLSKGTVSLGSVGGIDANAVAQTGQPIAIGGTDSGGTIRTVLVNSAGAMSVSNTAAGTFVNISTGTLTTGSLSNVAMLNAGTVTSVGSVVGVGILTAGTISMINNGTLAASGTTTGVGVVSMLTAGTVSMINAGTITSVGTVPGIGILTAGTISMINNGTLAASGTTTGVGVVTSVTGIASGTINNVSSGTINAATVVLNSGTINVSTAVISSLPNLPQGSINVTAGTERLDGRPNRNILTYGTTFSVTSGSAWGTLVGSAAVGAGTYIWVNDVSINNPAGSAQCIVSFGTTLNGTNVLLKGNYGTQTGVGQQKSFPLAVNGGMTNQDLVVYVGVPGTVDVNVSYFLSV